MNKLNLVITASAYEDLDTISDYIAKDNPTVAYALFNIQLIRYCSIL